MFLSLGGCQARLQANARSSTTSGSEANASAQSNANSNANASGADHHGHEHDGSGSSASFRARGSASGSVHVRGRGEGSANGQAQGQGNGQGSGGGSSAQPTPPTTRPERPREVDHARSATAGQRVITYTAPPRIEIKPAKRPPAFVGRVMPARRRAGRVRRPQTPTTPAVETPATPVAETPTTPPPTVEAPTPTTPVAEPTPPEPQPPAAPVPPPEAPPENVFGYEQPVLGCFEGQVYFIEANSQRLPRSYDDLESSAVLYACEWDIPTRAWEQGFPGLSDRFEWFAIRYTGAFNITKAGKYRFRMSSDDGGKVTIDGRVVIDNDGVHPPQDKSGEVRLSAGDHTMVIEYFQGPRYHINLQLFVTPPDAEEGIFSVRPQ